ncbi:MAG: hypothetical protein ACKOWF_17530 [Chloroflexota bacterium]
MDEIRFDAVTARLGAAMDRRAGLKSAFAGIAAALAGVNAAGVADAGKQRKRGRGRDGGAGSGTPALEGPCGKGARKNYCEKDKDCCTGLCNRKNNKCRCLSRGKACTDSKQCCTRGGQSQACLNGVCARYVEPGTIETGQPCQAGQTCKDTQATCTTYTNGAPAGTYCLLRNGAACGTTDGSCASQFCNGGVCEPCTVCSDRNACRYRTIGSAVGDAEAGDVIGIAAGTYDTYMEIATDNLTLRRCGAADAGSVLWAHDDGDGPSIDLEETGISALTLKDIDFTAGYQYEIILAKGESDKRLTLTIDGCTFTGKYDDSTDFNYSCISTDDYTNSTISDTTFTKCHGENDAGAAFSSGGDITAPNIVIMTNVTATNGYSAYQGGAFDFRKTMATLTNCTITGNTANTSGGGINIDGGGTTTLVDCTISGNTTVDTSTDGVGGGVSVRDNGNTGADISRLVIQGTTTITGNTATATNASNGGGVISKDGGIITGGTLTNITGNTPSGENCTTLVTGAYTTVSCATWI